MVEQWCGWSESQIEAIVAEYIDCGKFPKHVEADVIDHLEANEPFRALDIGLQACVRDSASLDR